MRVTAADAPETREAAASSQPLSPPMFGRRERSERGVLARFIRRRAGLVGLAVLALLAGLALAAPLVAPRDPLAQNRTAQFRSPSLAHPFGTDEFGRDILSRVIYGARISLLTGTVAVLIGACLGVPLGLLGGFFGGWIDAVTMRVLMLPAVANVQTVTAPDASTVVIAFKKVSPEITDLLQAMSIIDPARTRAPMTDRSWKSTPSTSAAPRSSWRSGTTNLKAEAMVVSSYPELGAIAQVLKAAPSTTTSSRTSDGRRSRTEVAVLIRADEVTH